MRVVNIPLTLGRADRVDPKLAPLGVLAVAKNLRVRKDGRLGSRTGYQPLVMKDQSNDDVVAYDLHEFSNGRLCALGSSQGEGHPVDVYEYRGTPSTNPWRSSDESGFNRQTLTPFTAPRQVCGVPQPAGGIFMVDCAAGNGYVCAVYVGQDQVLCRTQVVRESDDQVILARDTAIQGWVEARVCFANNSFFILGIDDNNALTLGKWTPGSTDTNFQVIATLEASGYTRTLGFLEVQAVNNGSSSVVICAYGLTSGTEVKVKRFNASGTQQGSTLTVSGLSNLISVDVEADEVDNTVNVVIGTTTPTVTLRSYNFSNTLLDGPTSLFAGSRPTICRLPAQSGWAESVCVVSSGIGATGDIQVDYVEVDTHTIVSEVIANAVLDGAVIPAQSAGNPAGVVFSGFVDPDNVDGSTNAIWYVDRTMVHMATRDLGGSARDPGSFYSPLGLSLDTSTGRLAWCSLYFVTGRGLSGVENFTITTLALHSTARRQGASAGGLLYLTGAPVQVYDGRIATEAGFNEVPGIIGDSQGTSGFLTQLATYSYVYVWEYNLPDGTFFESPPSPVYDVTLTGANDEVTLTLKGPHSARVALGDAAYGAEITGVLYRTVWDAANGSQGSQFKETQRFSCPTGQANYGDDISVNDDSSDTGIADEPTLYTQSGPLENNAPEMATYISASSARIDVAGLPRTSEFQESKEQDLSEGVNFSVDSAFFGRAPNPINGIVSLDGIRLVFTRTDAYAVAGDGPGTDGSGALPPPVEMPGPGGLKDWRSLLKGPDGVWAQFDDDKLYRLPRGSGAPEWLGVDIQDTLRLYPTITGASRCRADDAIMFACENSGGTDGRIVVRSLRTGLWTEDTAPLQTGDGIEALCSYGDRVAYISGGVVYVQSASSYADETSTVIETQVKTHPLYPFELGGYGTMHGVLLTGEFRSAGTLALRVSYDDGVSFTTYDSFTLSGLTVGQTVQRRWALQQMDTTSVVFEWTFTPSTAGEGFIAHNAALLVDDQTEQLRELDPAEMA